MDSAGGTPGSSWRVLGVIERRGFGLVALLAPPPEFGRSRALRVCVDADERDPVTLVRQLDKLFDVRRTELVARSRERVVST